MTILTIAFVRFSTYHSGIKYACSILIVITISIAGLYILLNVFWLFLLKFRGWVDKKKEKRKQNLVLLETLAKLKDYHNQNPSRIDNHHRRGAICVELPER